jgi:hypothetical protein
MFSFIRNVAADFGLTNQAHGQLLARAFFGPDFG